MLISNMFIHCKVKGKNFFTEKATNSKLQQLTEQESCVMNLDQPKMKCEYIKAGLGIRV